MIGAAEVGHGDVGIKEVDVRAGGVDAGIGKDIVGWHRPRERVGSWVVPLSGRDRRAACRIDGSVVALAQHQRCHDGEHCVRHCLLWEMLAGQDFLPPSSFVSA